MFRSHKDITRDNLKDNPRKTEENPDYYACNYCEDEYFSETEVEIHKRIIHRDIIAALVSDPKKIVCKICYMTFRDQDQLLGHLKVEHLFSSEDSPRVEREVFVCDICNQIFFNKQMLAVHIVHNHKESMKKIKQVQCPKCIKTLKLATVWYHFQCHEIQSVACCAICLKKCKNRMDLKNHLKLHPSHFYCDICGYQAKRSATFKEHIETHHNKSSCLQNKHIQDAVVKRCFIPRKPTFFKIRSQWGIWRGTQLLDGIYLCVLCREIVVANSNRDKLREHLEKAHMVDKQEEKKSSYLCACGESFFNKILLKHHVFKLKGDHRVADDSNLPHEPTVSADNKTTEQDVVKIEIP